VSLSGLSLLQLLLRHLGAGGAPKETAVPRSASGTSASELRVVVASCGISRDPGAIEQQWQRLNKPAGVVTIKVPSVQVNIL